MAFQFENSSSVLIGSFNIYIFQPPWMIANNLISPTELEIFSDMNRPGFRLSVKEDSIDWTIRPDSLSIVSNSTANDCGSLVGKVINALPHTPLFAIGNNIKFEAPITEIGDLLSRTFKGIDSSVEGYSVKQRTWHQSLSRGDSLVNMQLSSTEDKASLSINVHTELKGRGSSFAIDAAEAFVEDIDSAIQLTNQMLGIGIKYEHNNNAA